MIPARIFMELNLKIRFPNCELSKSIRNLSRNIPLEASFELTEK